MRVDGLIISQKCYSQDTSTRPQDVRPQLNKDKSPPRTHKPKETATKAKVAGKAVDDPLSELQPSKPSPNTRKPAHVRAKKAADKGQIAKEATKKAKVGVEANFHGEADAAAKSKVNAKVEVAPIPEVNTKTEVIANAKADSEVEATRKAVVSTKVETIANAKINIVVDDSANTKNDVKTVEETAPKADSGEVRFRPELGPLKLSKHSFTIQPLRVALSYDSPRPPCLNYPAN